MNYTLISAEMKKYLGLDYVELTFVNVEDEIEQIVITKSLSSNSVDYIVGKKYKFDL